MGKMEIEYDIISSDSRFYLSEKVNEMLGEGWHLRGELKVVFIKSELYDKFLYCQVMIKEGKK